MRTTESICCECRTHNLDVGRNCDKPENCSRIEAYRYGEKAASESINSTEPTGEGVNDAPRK